MSEAKSKQDLVRLAWIAALRRQGDRQCRGDYFDGASVCALGLLAEVAKLDPDEADAFGFDEIGALVGLSMAQSNEVWRRNDGACTEDRIANCAAKYSKHTFSEIADVIEGWFGDPIAQATPSPAVSPSLRDAP